MKQKLIELFTIQAAADDRFTRKICEFLFLEMSEKSAAKY